MINVCIFGLVICKTGDLAQVATAASVIKNNALRIFPKPVCASKFWGAGTRDVGIGTYYSGVVTGWKDQKSLANAKGNAQQWCTVVR